jgi:adenylate cyclase
MDFLSKNMSFRLRNRSEIQFIALGSVLTCLIAFLILSKTIGNDGDWSSYDYRLLDAYYRQAVSHGYGPQASFQPRVTYLAITDSSYNYFQKNILDRKDLARINDALGSLKPAAIAYDIIFARPSNPVSDQLFSSSLARPGNIYLPYACSTSDETKPSTRNTVSLVEQFRPDYLETPTETGPGRPARVVRALTQYDDFARNAKGAGDISVAADRDGVFRHITMLIKAGDRYLPSLSLAMFLDFIGAHFNEVKIEWGRQIIIPRRGQASDEAPAIHIPIDTRGRAFVPFIAPMGNDFPIMAAHTFLENFDQEDMRGNLADSFEGAFVFISDMAVGASDLGDTPLEQGVSLVTMHAAMLNGMLTGVFYHHWSLWRCVTLLMGICLLLGCTIMHRSPAVFYGCGAIIIGGIIGLSWIEFTHFRLFPIATIGALTLGLLASGAALIQFVTFQERSFIRATFSRYLPKKVVVELLQNPKALEIGGEEKEATVLFSDLADFTTLSESMPPRELVRLLNEYLTAMTDIILDSGGIIDKYEGDAIMAEFGIPLSYPQHADQAVQSSLKMQQRLRELRRRWVEKGQPPLFCRIGINSGKMLVGNMGSESVMDYTVIGDAVNLASRLEEANKLYGTSILISQHTFDQLTPGIFQVRPLDMLKVKGKSVFVQVYEVLGLAGENLNSQDAAYYRAYQHAFDAFLRRDFIAARDGFRQALHYKADDPAANRMIHRIATIDPSALPDDWSGGLDG